MLFNVTTYTLLEDMECCLKYTTDPCRRAADVVSTSCGARGIKSPDKSFYEVSSPSPRISRGEVDQSATKYPWL